MLLAFGVLAALAGKAKRSGKGQVVDAAMFDGARRCSCRCSGA